ncbi:mucolipin-3-like [Atheta coriaria]|uniref:mucolipin-3-like n=1 Tax=Dalotia coriaria TaxID=877792 RepID=UPI0031F3FA08
MEESHGNSTRSDAEDDELCAITHQRNCKHQAAFLSEERMRRKLQFFFMNPIEKWQAKRRFPYKFVVQVIKIILVTMQLCLFAYSRYNHVNYTWDNRITFSHLFLNGWDATMEINSYPPPAGPLAIYKQKEFYETIDYAYNGYASIGSAIGPYSYANEDNSMGPMKLCLYQYKKAIIYGFNESYVFNPEVIKSCYDILFNETSEVSTEEYLQNEDINFAALVRASLSFSLKTISFKSAGRITPPNCYLFNIFINFINEDHDGQMLLTLDTVPKRLQCNGDVKYIMDNQLDSVLRSLLNYFVIFTCVISFILCSRAIWRAQQLSRITCQFFRLNYNKELCKDDRMEFWNMWYIMIIINDIFIVIGSSIKERIESKDFTSDNWNICSVFLGTGNMLVWFGVLRYLGFFRTYNVVILTLKKATPQIFRFLLCALLIYGGFTFCGWLILGPYHLKFRSLSTTSECLFSLVNGDDMFATFSIMSNKSTMLWWFSRIYLYSFISLYIYVILNLFITVINDAYETIKLYYEEGFPKSDLHEFVGATKIEDFSSGLFRMNSDSSLGGLMKDLCCCKQLQKSYASLLESRNNLRREETDSDSSSNPV